MIYEGMSKLFILAYPLKVCIELKLKRKQGNRDMSTKTDSLI